MVAVADDNNDWLEMIHAAKAHGMTYQAIADVVGVHRSYILQAVHNLGNGSASPKHLAQKVRNTLGAFACPFIIGRKRAGSAHHRPGLPWLPLPTF